MVVVHYPKKIRDKAGKQPDTWIQPDSPTSEYSICIADHPKASSQDPISRIEFLPALKIRDYYFPGRINEYNRLALSPCYMEEG